MSGEPPIVTAPPARKIVVASGTSGSQYYIVHFREPLNGQRLGVAVDAISAFAPDARFQFALGTGLPDGLMSNKTLAVEYSSEGEGKLLRQLAEAFAPQVALTANAHVTQASLSFEVTVDVLNFDDTTPDSALEALVRKLTDVPGINQAARIDDQLVIQVEGQFSERRRVLTTDLEDIAGITVTFCSSPLGAGTFVYMSPNTVSHLFGGSTSQRN